MPRFHGVIPAMATPFSKSGNMDIPRVSALIDDYIEAGVHGISVAGSQGEFFALDFEERKQLIEASTKVIDGRVPLYAGTGGVTTDESIRLTQVAENAGADVALVITPYFIQPTQSELIEHFVTVAKSTKLPVLLYNNPPRTAVNILPSTVAECMSRAPNILGVKDSSGDVTQAIEYLLQTDNKGLLFSGRDTISLSLMLHGGHGMISPAANVFPEIMVSFYNEIQDGNYMEARRLSDILAPLRAAWALGSFPVVIKEAMNCVGRGAGYTRSPIRSLEPGDLSKLKNVIARIKSEFESVAVAS